MKMTEILPGLYIRGKFNNNWHKIDALREYNITTVVSMVSYVDEDLVHSPYVAYYSYPIADGKVIDLEKVNNAVTTVFQGLKLGANILVHCHGGKNRAGLVCALAIRRLWGISGRDAMEHVQKHRPGALNNEVFAAYLNTLEAPCSTTYGEPTEAASPPLYATF